LRGHHTQFQQFTILQSKTAWILIQGGGGGYRTASKTNLQQGEKKVNIKFNFLAINRKAQKVPMLL